MQNQGAIRQEIAAALLGGLEAALFIPKAKSRFYGEKKAVLRSFLAPVLLLPLTLAAVYVAPLVATGPSADTLALLHALRMIVGWIVFYGFVYGVSHGIDREDRFLRFVAANNWLSVPATIIFLPILLMLATGRHDWADLNAAMLVLTLYTWIFTAWTAAGILRIPWQLGGFLVIAGIFINDRTLDAILWLNNVL